MNTMTRRTFGRIGAGGLGLALGMGARGNPPTPENGPPPNIIFLLTDDHRWDALGCMGNSIIQTPRLDALAREGVVFENAYVTTSICSASRASILSGQYACRHGINDFAKTFTDEAYGAVYPMLLREAGYFVGFVGKYGVGATLPEAHFDYWRGYAGQGQYEHQDAQGNPIHLTRVHEEDAVAFLRAVDKDRPFCLSVSFKAPHCQDGDPRQFIYDPQYQELYRDAVIPPPPAGDDAFFEAFPDFFRENNEARKRWQLRFSTPDLYQEMVKAYYRLIAGVDEAVGRLRKELDALGLADNTIIVFTSDNGFFLGERGLAGKWYGYEPSIRTPLLVFDPRLPQTLRGARRRETVLNIDIAPTLLAMAGLTPPPDMQGCDLSPLLRGESPPWRQEFYYEHTFEHPGIPKSEGVAGGRYKYLRYFEQTPPYEELYDLELDPHETKNLAGDPDHAEKLEQLRRQCDTLKDACCRQNR